MQDADLDDLDYINPFDEVFDEKDVVNREEPFEGFDKDIGNDDDSNIGTKLMADIISDGENFSIKEISLDEDEYFGLIKKEDIESGKFKVEEVDEYQDEKPDIEPSHQVFDIENIDLQEPDSNEHIVFDIEKEDELHDSAKDESEKRPEEVIEEYLQANFKDFISLPKISGSLVKSSENNLIPHSDVSKTGKTIEITDDIKKTNDPHQKTSVIINRDSGGEIESIEVVCKCGERTLITFDYTTTKDLDDELTEIVNDPAEPIPFQELEIKSEDIMMVNPDLIISHIEDDNRSNTELESSSDDDEDDEYEDFFEIDEEN